MGNIVSYLKWRGDIPFDIAPFNDVDNLVLAQLSYVDFTGVVPDSGISLFDAYNLIVERGTYQTMILVQFPIDLLAEAAKSVRFGNTRLSRYVDKFDSELNLQFAAITFGLDDGTTYIAYRGTDDSITGWREDFMKGSGIVPAQREALEYARNAMEPGVVYRVGGQSKGGNLAVYATTMLERDLQSQIIAVYDNDGPGLSYELLASSGYDGVRDKVSCIVPEYSVVGNLFGHETNAVTIVGSSATGLMQHDSMTWEVEGAGFVTLKEHSAECVAVNEVFDNWIESVDVPERKVFVDNLFDALSAGGAKRITDIAPHGADSFEAILFALAKSEKPAKTTFRKLLKAAWARVKQINVAEVVRDSGVLRGAILAIVGLFFMVLPKQALVVSATTAIFACCILATRWLVRKLKTRKNRKVYSLIYAVVIAGLSAIFFINSKTILFSSNFVLGVLFFIYGFYRVRKTIADRHARMVFKVLRWTEALLSFAFGLVALVTTGEILGTYVLTVGTFFIVTGLRIIITSLYQMTEETSQ
ncbi:MAG: DUF2974 domain-containing protein [Propionibacteriaceae bacterium]|jgi:uncharacterized membrane protein HdeD (DUF308 family)|nr:DUF2974 domain-containing protein [Propionibacteriaceae bacterium]